MKELNLTQVTKEWGTGQTYKFFFYYNNESISPIVLGPYVERADLGRNRPGVHREYYVTIFKVIV
jgi:hypothetical protein